MILMPWTRLRLVREALAVGLDAQRRELTLRNLTGWDLASLNRALEQGTVEIVPSAEAREAIRDMATHSGYTLAEVAEVFQSAYRTRLT